MRLEKILPAAALAVGIASCSGGSLPQSPASGPLPANQSNNQPANYPQPAIFSAELQKTTASRSPRSTSTLTVNGVITNISSSSFALRLVGSCGGGHFDVGKTSSTRYSGPKLGLGYEAVVIGTGSCSTSITASRVTTSAAPPLTLSGTVAGKITDGFTIDSVSCGYLHVYVTSSTGSIPAVGAKVTVRGNGACSTYATASSIGSSGVPSPSTSMHHVTTADYLGPPYGTTSVSWSQAAQYLTWAETGTGDADAIAASGMKTMEYEDPNRTNVGGPMYTSNAATFATTCSGVRVHDQWDGAIEYVMNPASSAMRTVFADYVAQQKALGHFDAIFEDTAGPLSEIQVYDPFYPSLPCDYSDSAWTSAEIGLNQSVPLPVVFNGLSDLNGHSPSLSMGLLAGSNTIGGNFEECYSSNSQLKAPGWYWAATENTELEVTARNKLFECMVGDMNAASSQIDSRIYAYASFLLTYNPSTSVYRTEYATPSGLHVMPESELVPLSPTTAYPSSISALEQSGGTYARQFGQCFLKGVYVGKCAVVVNPNGTSAPFPYTTYHHTLVISGNGVLDSGTVATDGPAPPSTLGGIEAAIVFP